MFNAHRHVRACLLFAAGLMIAAPACATGYYGRQHDSYRDFERQAYENGLERGLRHGERDARDGRSFSFERDREYRDADWGYRRGADRDDYRRSFRRGYQQGYTDGFNRFARAGEGYGRPGVAVYRSPAVEIGFRDGLEAGRNDARDRNRFDPVRAKRYRDGDHDYDSRYGSRDAYRRDYRAAFQQGYEQGFREYRR